MTCTWIYTIKRLAAIWLALAMLSWPTLANAEDFDKPYPLACFVAAPIAPALNGYRGNMWEDDKFRHAGLSCLMASVIYTEADDRGFSKAWGFIMPMVFGLIKEGYDRGIGGRFDLLDVTANAIGAGMPLLLFGGRF